MASLEKYKQLMLALEARWERENVKLLNHGGVLYSYRDGFWRALNPIELDQINSAIYDEAHDLNICAPEKENAIWRMLRVHSTPKEKIEMDSEPALALANGTYFVEADKLKKHDPLHYITRHLPVDYRPKAKCPEWVAMLDRIFEDYPDKDRFQITRFLQEWFGVSIIGGARVLNNRHLRKGVFLKGPKGGGKSTISAVLRHMLGGPERCAALSIDTAKGDFGLAPLVGKAALISDDGIEQATKAPANFLKKIVTGESITVNRKNKDHIEFSFNGPVLFTTNHLPKLNDVGDATYDRYVVIEVTRTFDAKDAKKTLHGYVSGLELLIGEDEFPGILNWTLDGYDAAVERGRLLIPKVARTAQEAFRRSNDVIFDFLRECCEFDPETTNICSVMSGVATEYAASAHGVRIGAKSAGNSLVETVPNVYPAVKIAHVSYGTFGQERSYVGLKLNDRGLAYKDRALQSDVPAVKMHKGKINAPRRGANAKCA